MPALQPAEQFGRQVRVGTDREHERDSFVQQPALQTRHTRLDPRRVVLVEPRIDVRRARRGADAVGDGDARHLERRRLVGRAVVDAGQQVAVEVDHEQDYRRIRRAAGSGAPGWNITPASAANHIAFAGMCNAKSKRLCSIIGAMPRPAPSCNSVKLRPSCDRRSSARRRIQAANASTTNDGRREPQLHERLQIIVVRVVDESADVGDLEPREHVGVRGQPAAEREKLDGGPQRGEIDGPAKVGARLQLPGLQAAQERPDTQHDRDAERNHDEADHDQARCAPAAAIRTGGIGTNEHERRARESHEARRYSGTGAREQEADENDHRGREQQRPLRRRLRRRRQRRAPVHMPARAQAVDEKADDHRQRHRQQRGEVILVDERPDGHVLARLLVPEVQHSPAARPDLKQSKHAFGGGENREQQQEPRGVRRGQPHRPQQTCKRRQQCEPAVFGGGRNHRNRAPRPAIRARESIEHGGILIVSRQRAPYRVRQRNQLQQWIDQQDAERRRERTGETERRPLRHHNREQQAERGELEQEQRDGPVARLVQRRQEQEDGETTKKHGARRLHW